MFCLTWLNSMINIFFLFLLYSLQELKKKAQQMKKIDAIGWISSPLKDCQSTQETSTQEEQVINLFSKMRELSCLKTVNENRNPWQINDQQYT